MESNGSTAPSGVASPSTVGVRSFSNTIAATYVGVSFFGLLLLIASVFVFRRAMASPSPALFILSAIELNVGIGLLYVVVALRQRRTWARYAAVGFWALCLIWTGFTIVRNGLHPEPAAGPFEYSNADQLAGARFAAFATPYVLALVESAAIYCLLRRARVVNQFQKA